MDHVPLGRHWHVRVDSGGHGVEPFGVDRRPGVQVAPADLAEVTQVLPVIAPALVLDGCLPTEEPLLLGEDTSPR